MKSEVSVVFDIAFCLLSVSKAEAKFITSADDVKDVD